MSEAHTADLATRDRILGGDRDEAADMFRQHVDSLYEFVHYRVGGDRGLTEDVVQDTFIVALQRIHSFDGRSTLHTWLCGIAKNKIRAWRRKRRPVALPDLLEDADEAVFEILAEVDRSELPEWVLERKETQALVGATLSSLPPNYRKALVEKYVEGLSVKEMAGRVGKSPKATESVLQRARVAFARVFQLLDGRAGGGS